MKALLSVLVSGGLLALILSRLDLGSLGGALKGVSLAGFGLAALMFGAALLCTGLRWRIGLRLAGVPLSLAANLRAVSCGHTFNMVLFGPAGGDVAKSAAYSRWYGLSIHELLVSAIMDRSMAALASMLFAALTVALVLAGPVGFGGDAALDAAAGVAAVESGALPADEAGGVGGWLALALGLGLVGVGITWRLRHHPFVANMRRSLRSTFRAAAQSPGSVANGALLGLAAQVLMSLAMGVALWSVTAVEVPWRDVLWTFPLITAVAALPTSFGGAGVREGVSILLLARYGIPAEDLVAAGFVYLATQLAWAVLGAGTLAWEERRFGRLGVSSGEE